MNDGMWESKVPQDNIAALRERGITVIDPENGELACGTSGKGRMMESEEIFKALK